MVVVTGPSGALRVLQLVQAAAGCKADFKVDANVKTATLSSAKLTLEGTNTVAQFLVGEKKDLTGATAEEEAQACKKTVAGIKNVAVPQASADNICPTDI